MPTISKRPGNKRINEKAVTPGSCKMDLKVVRIQHHDAHPACVKGIRVGRHPQFCRNLRLFILCHLKIMISRQMADRVTESVE